MAWASDEVDLSERGRRVYLWGNVLQKGSLAQKSHVVAFAAERCVKRPNDTSTLVQVHPCQHPIRRRLRLRCGEDRRVVNMTVYFFAGGTKETGLIDCGFFSDGDDSRGTT